jgi:hypothetical protein
MTLGVRGQFEGAFLMATDTWRRSVVFILDREGGSPIGTGFIVIVPNEANGPGRLPQYHAYVVTVGHVIDNSPKSGAMRLRTRDGHTVHDYPLGTWEIATDDDVAAQECDFGNLDPPVEFNAYRLDEAIDKQPLDVRSGEQCYFVGLLGQVPKMHDTMMPMVRSAALGAYMQEGVPIKLTPTRTITAHLIDGRSLGGFSGSPCFVQITAWVESSEPGKAPQRTS